MRSLQIYATLFWPPNVPRLCLFCLTFPPKALELGTRFLPSNTSISAPQEVAEDQLEVGRVILTSDGTGAYRNTICAYRNVDHCVGRITCAPAPFLQEAVSGRQNFVFRERSRRNSTRGNFASPAATGDTVADGDAAVSPVAPRRRAEMMHVCDLANEKAFLKQNDVTILQPKNCRPFVH